MFERFLAYIRDENLLDINKKVLLAVSGGMDSMVLTTLCIKSGISIGVAHFNHHLRGQESDYDAAFVEEFCKKHSLSCHIQDLDPNILKKGNLQENARILRYKFLRQLADKYQYQYIATAHHADDQIETFFINLMRGSGLTGLSSIPAIRDNVIRPLLFADRKTIAEYCTQEKISYREDSSNETDHYLRNRIRHLVIPELYQSDVRAIGGIRNSIIHLNATNQLLEFFLDKHSLLSPDCSYEQYSIHLSDLPLGVVGYQWLFYTIRKFGFNMEQTKVILDSRDISGRMFYSVTHEALSDRGKLIIRRKKPIEIMALDVRISIPCEIIWNNKVIKIVLAEEQSIYKDSPRVLYINADHLTGRLMLRMIQPGDKFKPVGMGGKSKKIKDFLINQKVSLFDKESIVVLTHDDEIIAIPGYRKSENVKIRPDTLIVWAVMISNSDN